VRQGYGVGDNDGGIMTQYDAGAIRKFATLLNGLATGALVVSSVLGLLSAIGAGLQFASAPLGLLVGVLVVGTYILLGWLVSIGLRAGAQLMLVLVQIEANTARAAITGSATTVDGDEVASVELASQTDRIGKSLEADELFRIGKAWALRYDATGNPDDRAEALAAMTEAHAKDPRRASIGYYDDGFGTLAADPEFRLFVSV
jgi:hypothetical protein